MAKKKETIENRHPFDWAQIAIGRCTELLSGYEFLKNAIDDAQKNLREEGRAVTRGCSDAARDVSADWRRLNEHLSRCPRNWAVFLSDLKHANEDHLKAIHIGKWIATTAAEAVEYQAEELRDRIGALLFWLPGPAPVLDHTYFVRNPQELKWLSDTVKAINAHIAECTPESLDKLRVHIDHEFIRYENHLAEQNHRSEDAERRERELAALMSVATIPRTRPPEPLTASEKKDQRAERVRELYKEHGLNRQWAKLRDIANEDPTICELGLPSLTDDAVAKMVRPSQTRRKTRRKTESKIRRQ